MAVPVVTGLRLLLGFMRAIHELVWAWLFVAALGLSPMAAVLALAIPYGGILGRIYADILNDVPDEPLEALRTSGASELKVLVYGRLPMALPDMLGYGFYRLECAIRAVAIMGFVGVGGLGLQVQLSLDDLLYREVWTLLYAIIGPGRVGGRLELVGTEIRSRVSSPTPAPRRGAPTRDQPDGAVRVGVRRIGRGVVGLYSLGRQRHRRSGVGEGLERRPRDSSATWPGEAPQARPRS